MSTNNNAIAWYKSKINITAITGFIFSISPEILELIGFLLLVIGRIEELYVVDGEFKSYIRLVSAFLLAVQFFFRTFENDHKNINKTTG